MRDGNKNINATKFTGTATNADKLTNLLPINTYAGDTYDELGTETIVKRDGSGNFKAGTITADLIGTADNADKLGNRDADYYIYGVNASGSSIAETTWVQTDKTQCKSGFWNVHGASWMPDTDWWWGETIAHVENKPSYLYGAQMAFSNSTSHQFIYRGMADGSTGTWKTVANLEEEKPFTGAKTFSGAVTMNSTVTANKFTSTATTTAPFTVESNIVVTNLNADKLDGQDGTYYRNASNLNDGTINDARLPDTISSNITGTADNADKISINSSSSTLYLSGTTTAPKTSSSNVSLYTNANIYATDGVLHAATLNCGNISSSGTLDFTSDERLKNKIKLLNTETDISDAVLATDIYEYSYIYDPTAEHYIGVMAQDIEQNFPDMKELLVNISDDPANNLSDKRSLKETKLVYVL